MWYVCCVWFVCVCVYVCVMHICTQVKVVKEEARRAHQINWSSALCGSVYSECLLKAILRTSSGAASTLNLWAFPLAPAFLFLDNMFSFDLPTASLCQVSL